MSLVLEEGRRGPRKAQLFHVREKCGQWLRKRMPLSPPTSAKNLNHKAGQTRAGEELGPLRPCKPNRPLRGSESLGLCWPPRVFLSCWLPAAPAHPHTGGRWRLLAGRYDPRIHIWWPLASQEMQRSELATRLILLCPPPPSGRATHWGLLRRCCRSSRSPVGNSPRTAPAGPPSLWARRVSARSGSRDPAPDRPGFSMGYWRPGCRAAELGPRTARGAECPQCVCPPWSHGEPGRARGQWVSSRCHQLH